MAAGKVAAVLLDKHGLVLICKAMLPPFAKGCKQLQLKPPEF